MLLSGKIPGLAVAVLSCGLLAASTPPNVIYTASGNFATPPLLGADMLKLAGEPFTFSILANTAMPPTTYGANFATYTPLKFSGTLYSNLLPGVPINITGQHAFLSLNNSNAAYDQLQMSIQELVLNYQLKISALVTMPKGTLVNLHIHPFAAPITLTSATASMTYADTTASTTLGIIGTGTTTISPVGPDSALARPEAAGVELDKQAPTLFGAVPAILNRRMEAIEHPAYA